LNEKKLVLVLISISILIISSAIYLIQNIENQPVSNKTDYIQEIKTNIIPIDEKNPIKVGIIHSLSGTMAISESAVADSTLLAIEEINQRGGLLGRKIQPIVVDGASDWDTFAGESERLITEEKVSVVFGGWTSASRKMMLPVFEKYNHLLFYPVQYEGLEQSPNIVYTGAAPNQQVLPAVDWACENIGCKFFLIGSDYVFPRSANEIIKLRVAELEGEILGEEYRVLGDQNFNEIILKIKNTNPDVILNTINGDSNLYFFKQLREHGIYPQDIPTISFSIGENEIAQLMTMNMTGDFAAWNYFQVIDSTENKNFVKNFQNKYGKNRTVTDPMEAAYIGVYLFAKAVEKVELDDTNKIRGALKGLTLVAPEGVVGIDPQTQHLSKIVRIGEITDDGQFKIISSSEVPVIAEPYPKYKTKNEWNLFLSDLYRGWNNKWANLGNQTGE
jgi:urea transport system substrate-binding protein